MQPLTQHNNFIFFTLSLVILLLASAITHMLPTAQAELLSHILTLVTVAVAYVSLNFGRYWHRFVATQFVLASGLGISQEFFGLPGGDLARLIVILIFFVASAYNASRQVLMSDEVKINIVVGALAIYLLLGLIWATLYQLVLLYYPASFHGINSSDTATTYPELLYFSYVTLTTLGYGDITPAIPLTRTLAFLEAIAGTFYLAIVVASLIGAMKHRREP